MRSNKNVRAQKMMKRIFLIVILILSACSQQGADEKAISISATACAKQSTGGAIVECEPSDETEAYLDNMLAESSRIDKEFPGPTMPSLDNLFDVKRIGNDGAIYLKSGTVLELAGVSCDHPDLVKFLRASFVSPFQNKLSFKESGYQENGRVYAYLWEVNIEFGKDLGDEELNFGPMVSPINENALTSGWCYPEMQTKHDYHDRYVEISKLAR